MRVCIDFNLKFIIYLLMCCFEFKIMLNLKIHVVGVVFRKNCFKKVFDMFCLRQFSLVCCSFVKKARAGPFSDCSLPAWAILQAVRRSSRMDGWWGFDGGYEGPHPNGFCLNDCRI